MFDFSQWILRKGIAWTQNVWRLYVVLMWAAEILLPYIRVQDMEEINFERLLYIQNKIL